MTTQSAIALIVATTLHAKKWNDTLAILAALREVIDAEIAAGKLTREQAAAWSEEVMLAKVQDELREIAYA